MACLNPIMLKSGITVGCGKCELCRSDLRTQWSVRLAIHTSYCDRMPLFICLTYDDAHLPYCCNEDYPDAVCPTLNRGDVSKFLKHYKRKYNLTNDKFTYFGCGEYGDTFGRPHYHLLFFGDDELYDLYFKDSDLAVKRLEDEWKLGFVSIGIAQWSGIHYVTKYILKEDYEQIKNSGVVPPFLIGSKGLGMSFLDSGLAAHWTKQLQWLQYNKDYIFENLPEFSLDDICSIDGALDYLRRFVPTFLVPVDDGRFVYLPTALRKRLIGSTEHFKDGPMWLYNHLYQLKKSLKYYKDFGDYDATHEVESWRPALELRVQKIKQRLYKRKYDNIYKHSKL